MQARLQILLLEDNTADTELIVHELEAAGFSFSINRVEVESEFRKQLKAKPDLILSDHGLAEFSGYRALEIVRELDPQLPFIFVSGWNDQQMILEMFELGATDYVFKRDIEDLRLAVKRALEPEQETESCVTSEISPPVGQAVKPVIDRLIFCPHCQQAWDEGGHRVFMEDYCGNHIETVVFCHVCMKCDSTLKKVNSGRDFQGRLR
ncbi:MAG: response regulator [Verrucomicrobiota bacterium]|jgi:CheY-like chemotaxis protein